MRKSEVVASQFSSVVRLLELADGEMQMIRQLDLGVMQGLNQKLMELMDEVEDAMYETCAPIEMVEDARDAEIAALERRLADLKSKEIV